MTRPTPSSSEMPSISTIEDLLLCDAVSRMAKGNASAKKKLISPTNASAKKKLISPTNASAKKKLISPTHQHKSRNPQRHNHQPKLSPVPRPRMHRSASVSVHDLPSVIAARNAVSAPQHQNNRANRNPKRLSPPKNNNNNQRTVVPSQSFVERIQASVDVSRDWSCSLAKGAQSPFMSAPPLPYNLSNIDEQNSDPHPIPKNRHRRRSSVDSPTEHLHHSVNTFRLCPIKLPNPTISAPNSTTDGHEKTSSRFEYDDSMSRLAHSVSSGVLVGLSSPCEEDREESLLQFKRRKKPSANFFLGHVSLDAPRRRPSIASLRDSLFQEDWEIDRLFGQLDLDSNGTLDMAEFHKGWLMIGSHGISPQQAFIAADTNGDGALSLTEFRVAVKCRFSGIPKPVSPNTVHQFSQEHELQHNRRLSQHGRAVLKGDEELNRLLELMALLRGKINTRVSHLAEDNGDIMFCSPEDNATSEHDDVWNALLAAHDQRPTAG